MLTAIGHPISWVKAVASRTESVRVPPRWRAADREPLIPNFGRSL